MFIAGVVLLTLGLSSPAADAAADLVTVGAVVAQAGTSTDPEPAPRFQPVGNGDAIANPVEPAADSGSDNGSWWRIVIAAAVAVVVLVALVQRRQSPDQRRGSGVGRGGRPNRRDVLGH
jgi:hypothetical protein